jgi:hypothetical protein
MKVFHSHGSKERLFEMMKRVNSLNETLLPMEEKIGVVGQFVDFVDEKLGLGEDMPKVRLSHDSEEAAKMKSYGRYVPETDEIRVVAVNRNLGDILRTIAHELIHHKQNKDGKLTPNSGETGSDVENEANALAGVLMREFGKNHPVIFE